MDIAILGKVGILRNDGKSIELELLILKMMDIIILFIKVLENMVFRTFLLK
jgi:hypothetical protein